MIKRLFLLSLLYSSIAYAAPECWVKDECASGSETRFVSESEQSRAESKNHECTLTPNDQSTCQLMCHAKYKTKSIGCTMDPQKQPDAAPDSKKKTAKKKVAKKTPADSD